MKFLQSPNAVYLGVAIGVVLLAPYAGCHLLITQKPAINPDDATGEDPLEQRIERHEKTGRADRPLGEPKHLSEIEDLLAK